MIAFGLYLGKASLILSVHYLFYRLFLANLTFFKSNRIFLFSGMCLTLILPFIHIDLPIDPISPNLLSSGNELHGILYAADQKTSDPISTTNSIDPLPLIFIAYWLGVIGFVIRFLIHTYQLKRLIEQSNSERRPSYTLYYTHNTSTFTFINNVFLPISCKNPLILEHEIQHVKQKHWIDLVLLELLQWILWFLPIYYWFSKAVRTNHEFLADQAVVSKKYSIEEYLRSIVSHVEQNTWHPLVQNFNSNPFIKRIDMITKIPTSKSKYLIYGLALPLVAMVLCSFVFFEPGTSEPILKSEIKNRINSPVENNYKLVNKPTASPLNNIQIVSGFGKRKHPIYQKLLHHQGIDLKARTGEPVYATADGTVIKSLSHESRGNYIVVKHDNIYSTSYSHLNIRGVSVGEKVKKGQQIGEVGNTGLSTNSHLHYEVIMNGVAVNPQSYLNP